MQHLGIVGIGIGLFATTNIDDIFVLLGFFSDPAFKTRQVVLGQYLGIITLIALSILGVLIAGLLPMKYIGFLGFFPLAIGIKKLFALRKLSATDEDALSKSTGDGHMLSVAAVTVANGGDNISVYVPVFAQRPHWEVVELSTIFLMMTAIWCAVAHGLVNHQAVGRVLLKYGHFLLPFVYIGLGTYILIKSNSFAVLFHG